MNICETHNVGLSQNNYSFLFALDKKRKERHFQHICLAVNLSDQPFLQPQLDAIFSVQTPAQSKICRVHSFLISTKTLSRLLRNNLPQVLVHYLFHIQEHFTKSVFFTLRNIIIKHMHHVLKHQQNKQYINDKSKTK